ncbi:MAG: hypothetical protein L3J46_08455 [Kangiellaceae bacterium]|nr:hypothetical protein [Kangiellaceae bacterium]
MIKAILCLDFDGTIHSYSSGWKGADVIPDKPVEGAFEFIRNAGRCFDVHIYSARSGLPGGIEAMQTWFIQHGWETDTDGLPTGISFPSSKPPAHVSIDDRALTFSGVWPEIEMLKQFRPWNDLDI